MRKRSAYERDARDDVRPFPNNWILEHIPIDRGLALSFYQFTSIRKNNA